MIYLKSIVGIEIRKNDLIITCLRSNFSAGVFTSFRKVSDYRDRDREEVRRELDSFFRQEQVNRENIVLGIPGDDVILRYLDFPKEVRDNLNQVVFYQVQSLEPSEEERFYFDYSPVSSGSNGKKIHVLLAMIKKATLDAHLEVLGELGIRPTTVTVGSVALANMFLGTQEDVGKTYILADVQPSSLQLLVLRNGSLVYTHEVLKDELAEWKSILLRELEVAVGKVRMNPEESIEGIYLSGESSEALRQELRDELQDCDLMENQVRFEMPARNRDYLQAAAVSLGCCYSGMVRKPAMKLNLLPAGLRIRQTRWAYVPAIILSLLIVALLTGFAFRQRVQERILERELNEEISRLESPVAQFQTIRSQSEALEDKIIFLEGLAQRRYMNLEILRELTEILPDDTYLTRYRNTDCTIEIVGLSPSAPDLLPRLEDSPLLVDVEQRGTIFKDSQTGKDRFTFTMRCER